MDVYIPIIRDSGDEKSPDTNIELKANPYIGADEIARRVEERILQKKEKQIEEMARSLRYDGRDCESTSPKQRHV